MYALGVLLILDPRRAAEMVVSDPATKRAAAWVAGALVMFAVVGLASRQSESRRARVGPLDAFELGEIRSSAV